MIRNLVNGVRIAAALNRISGPVVLSIAQRGLKNPQTLTPSDIKSVCASVLSQSVARRKESAAEKADDDWQGDGVQGQ